MERLPVTAHLLQPVIIRARQDPGKAVAAYRDGDLYVDVPAGELYRRIRPTPSRAARQLNKVHSIPYTKVLGVIK